MADEVEKLAGNLSDLNKVSLQAGIEFQGLTKRLIVMSDNVSGAGKKWTIFSRIVSGSPIWKLQNKVRAFVDSLAMIQEASEKNAKLAKEQNEKIIEQVQAYETLTPQLEILDDLMLKNTSSFQLATYMQSEQNKEAREAIKGTLAYNKAILEGVEVNDAYTKGLEELVEKGKQQAEVFKEAQKVAQFEKGMQTKAGRAGISADIKAEQEALRETDFFLSKKRGTKTIATKEGTAEVEKTLFEDMRDNMLASLKQGDRLKKFQEKMAKRTLKYRKGMIGLQKTMKPVLNYAFKVMIMLMLGIMGFLVLAKFIYDSLGILQEMGVINDIMEIGSLVLDNVMLIFSMIGALLSGDIYTFMDYALEFVDNLLLIGLGIIKVVLKGLIALAIGVFYTGLDIIHKFFTDDKFRSAVFKIAKKALFIFLAAYVIKQIMIQMLTVAAIYAMPLLIAVAVGAFIMAAVKWVADKINPFASGGVTKEGLSLVGEKGPELVALPKGSRVHSNSDSKKMVASSGSVVNNFNITVNAKDLSDAELRRVAKQLGMDIFKNINRTITGRGFV